MTRGLKLSVIRSLMPARVVVWCRRSLRIQATMPHSARMRTAIAPRARRREFGV